MSGLRSDAVDVVRRRPKDRKQQILVHARDLFVELGYHNVTMGALAERVGITPSALYRHFANKAVLLEAVMQDSFGDFEFPEEAAITLEEALSEASVIAVARPLGALWSREVRHLSEDARAEVRATLRRSNQAYVRLILRARPDLSEAQAELVAWGIQSVMASPSYRTMRIPAAEHAALLVRTSRAIAGVALTSRRGPRPDVRRSGPGLVAISRRERLLVAAMRLFAERGYQETAMADVGAAADVTGPNLYGYFDNKAALLRAVFERGTHALWLDLEDALQAHTDPREALGAVVASYVSRRLGSPSLGRQLTGEPDVEEVARSYQREYVAEWVALLRQRRPQLDQRTARMLVHIAIAVADDLTATPHLATSAGFAANVSAIALAVLDTEA